MTETQRDHANLVAILAALGANVAVAASKITAFLFTGSSSMLAESAHSVADSLNEVLLLVGGRAADQRPTRRHPFGFGRERYVFAFVVAILLFLVGGVFALWRGITKLQQPEVLSHHGWAIGVLLAAAVFEGISLRTAVKRSGESQPTPSILHFVFHAKTPELIVVVLEDLGALAGIGFALTGVIVTSVTHDPRWDASASIAIGALMVGISVVLATRTRSLLVGEAAHPPVTRAIASALTDCDTIERVVELRTQHLGPELLLVAARIGISATASATAIADAIGAAKQRIRKVVPYKCVIYLEPALSHSRAT